ncbi:MAG: hypothetical protein JWQ96_3346 [Segetibacter sp.]|nr:hypothetical protein [Segetibacter sp.]
MKKPFITFLLLFAFITSFKIGNAQQITGAWKGKINNQRVELKIIQKGDSLTGTSYYHGLLGNHKRYSIKGYFDPNSNSVVWWDDELITAKGANAIDNSQLSVADFNCPGSGRMYLDGKSSKKQTPEDATGEVSLTKINNPTFHDEWDHVLDNWTEGGNDPYIIDSVSRIATAKNTTPAKPVVVPAVVQPPVVSAPPQPIAKATPAPVIPKKAAPTSPPTIHELFTTRKKTFAKEILIEGDSIQLQFYDNAEVDGDSITLYLNNKMIFTHVRLTATPFAVTLPVKELGSSNDLVMVAENLGSIPPNTAFMIAMVNGKRYEAYLESTEGSSSLIRFTKKN